MGKALTELTKGIEQYKADIEIAMENPEFGGRCKNNLLIKFGILTRYLICWAKRHDIYTKEVRELSPQDKYKVLSKLYERYKSEGRENFGTAEEAALKTYKQAFNDIKKM